MSSDSQSTFKTSNLVAEPTVSEERAVRNNPAGAAAIIKRQQAEIANLREQLRTAIPAIETLKRTRDELQAALGSNAPETSREPSILSSAVMGLDTLLRIAVSHIDMTALEISHHTHWALLVAFAGPAVKTTALQPMRAHRGICRPRGTMCTDNDCWCMDPAQNPWHALDEVPL